MYIIQEIQTSNNQTALVPAIIKTTTEEMESTYHSIMASAAQSSVEIHTCVVFDEYGNNCTPGRRYYTHAQNPSE